MSDYEHLLLHRTRRDAALHLARVTPRPTRPLRRRWTGAVDPPVPTPLPRTVDLRDDDQDAHREEPARAR